ncbi:hypothetical protein VTI28DRAFT_3243 [Corynascus sepedonium]
MSPSPFPLVPISTSISSVASTYATVSFHKSDTIRLLNFPLSIVTAVEPAILASWPPGVQSQSQDTVELSAEFKLKDKPFGYYHIQQNVGALRLVRDVLAVLHNHDWELVTSVLCSTRCTAKDTLIFRQRRGQISPARDRGTSPVEWLVLAPLGKNKLRMVYDVNGGRMHGEVDDSQCQDHLGILVTGIKKLLVDLRLFDKGDWSHDSFEVQLKGTPWRSRGEASVTVRIILMKILELMEGHGWRLYVTMVQRSSDDEYRALDTWYFVREKQKLGTAALAG